MATNILVNSASSSFYTAEASVVGEPVIIQSVSKGIALISTPAVTPLKPTTLVVTFPQQGVSGYWTNLLFVMYAITAVGANAVTDPGNGNESLPGYIVVDTSAAPGTPTDIRVAWDAMADAVSYNVYRGAYSAAAATIGVDLIKIANTTDAFIVDDGYNLTQYLDASLAALEDVTIKGSSVRPPNCRQSMTRITGLAPGMLTSVMTYGVAEFDVDPSGTDGLAAIDEGDVAYWSASDKWVTLSAGGNTAIGKFTLGYLPSTSGKVAVVIRGS